MKKVINSGSRFLFGIGIIIAIIAISASCSKSSMATITGTGGTGGSPGTTPGANEVFIQGMAFNPATITISAGTTVTWTNKDAVNHTVTSLTALFGSGSLDPGATFSFTFPAPGTYSYKCSIHQSMSGSVVVN